MAVDHHFNKLMLSLLKNITSIFISLCLMCFVVNINPAAAELQTFHHPLVIKGHRGGSGVVDRGGGGGSVISFLVIGDWGRRGTYNQSQLAVQMGIIGEELDIDFIISTGDNFYDSGLSDENDPAFEDSFTNIYTAPSLQKQWYTVLGNHDYRGNALAQLSPILAQKDSRWVCSKSFILNADIAEFFFIDTTPFQDKYFTDPEDQVYDWRGVQPRKNYISTLLKDLDLALRESTSKWKIVVGHHPIKSSGYHGNTKELVTLLLPVLQANNVDFYINGHDHCLEHITCPDSPLQYFTSGGGSKAWRGEMSWWNPVETKFYYDGQGFMSMQITQNQVYVVFYDLFGKAIHKWSTSKLQLLYNAI